LGRASSRVVVERNSVALRTILAAGTAGTAVTAVAGAGAFCLMLTQASAAPAPAAATRADASPVLGEAPVDCSFNNPLQVRTSLVTVDFRGGVKVSIEASPQDQDPTESVRMRLLGCKVMTEQPQPDQGRAAARQAPAPTRQTPGHAASPGEVDYRVRAIVTTADGTQIPLIGREPLQMTNSHNPASGLPRTEYEAEHIVDLVDPAHPRTVHGHLLRISADQLH
jgi:hypothetical protein